MNKVLVLGSNPASGKRPQRKNTTLTKVAKWMRAAGVEHYDFANVIPHHVEKEHERDVDGVRVMQLCYQHPKIVTLGTFAHGIVKKLGFEHYQLPHPSPRNRKFNVKGFEEEMLLKLIESGYLTS